MLRFFRFNGIVMKIITTKNQTQGFADLHVILTQEEGEKILKFLAHAEECFSPIIQGKEYGESVRSSLIKFLESLRCITTRDTFRPDTYCAVYESELEILQNILTHYY